LLCDEEQGIRLKWSCTDVIFTIKEVMKRQHNIANVHFFFFLVDVEKAFYHLQLKLVLQILE
jgi:hypothetical protein